MNAVVHRTGRPAVEVRDLTLRYRVPHEKVGSIKEYAIRRLRRGLRYSNFCALENVSFDVMGGEVFGIVGRNGAGKTTLLKVIARVIRPTSGRVIVRGLVAPLLSLGVGFHEELTGQENVLLSGTALGFSIADMKKRMNRIVDFAGLGEFIHAPLRTYSTGMRARLGFAVATDIEPDVLLLDEIMSVGDAEFRERCEMRITAFREHGATVLLVSHGLATISSLCTRALLLHQGQKEIIGTPEEVLARYDNILKGTSTPGGGPP